MISDFQTKIAILAVASAMLLSSGAIAQDASQASPPPTTLITNVSIFNGTSEKLIKGKAVVVKGNMIDAIVDADGNTSAYDTVIDGRGGYLTPGLIDVHWHAMFGVPPAQIFSESDGYLSLHAAVEAEQQLLRGVTTIRDTGGNVFGLKKAIDQGLFPGPRIYPSGAIISQYSGHGDFRFPNPTTLPKEWGGGVGTGEANGTVSLVNGRAQMLAAVRQQLFLGATQLKLAVTGGVESHTDPLYVMEFTADEIKAAVDAASDYGTYVLVHAHSADGTNRALENGILSIDHGTILNEETVELMAEKGAALTVSLQVLKQLKSEGKDPVLAEKLQQATDGTANTMEWAKKHKVLMGFGTDLLFDPKGRQEELKDLSLRKEWYSSAEIMIQATGNGGKIVALSGKRNPYGKLGVIEKDAMADLLIYARNPLEDVSIVEDYENNLKLIIKDGKVYKNDL